jgi:hypothetical protein
MLRQHIITEKQPMLEKHWMKEKQSILKKQRGVSTIELIPVLLVFVLLLNFSLGFFGVIHSGILNSIASRNYAFETFRNRSDLNRFREDTEIPVEDVTFNKYNYRYHSILVEGAPSSFSGDPEWYVTNRPIRFTDQNLGIGDDTQVQDHRRVHEIQDPGRAKDVYDEDGGLRTVWIRTVYGICLNHRCQPP